MSRDPHTGRVPIRFRGFSIQPPSSKNPDIGFDGTSVSCVACWRGTACPGRASNPPRPAAGPLKSTHPANLLKFTAPTRGTWVWRRFAMRRRRRRCDVSTPSGPAPAYVIGPKGPIIVEPLGSTAVRPVGRTDSPPEGGHVWRAWGVLVRSDGGPLDGGSLRVWLYSLLKRPANKRVLFSFCDVWSVPDSHFLFQFACQQAGTVNGAPASGLWFPEEVVHVRPAYA